MTITTVVGARPQFIKAAVLSRLIMREHGSDLRERIVHTGQHYDDSMSAVFFREMEIPEPDANLCVGSGLHGAMTGRMLELIEADLLANRPDRLLVYGDTNSTLAGALAASKLGIPVVHVEAGLRSYWREMPEEQNRVLTDYLSSMLFCPTASAAVNLAREGIVKNVHVVGDIMLDAATAYASIASSRPPTERLVTRLALDREAALLTIHRAENTDDVRRLSEIVHGINACPDRQFVFPMHPRTKRALEQGHLEFGRHVVVLEPVGYLDMIDLTKASAFVLTDSGGLQKEAFFHRRPCLTLRDQTEWGETVSAGWNTLVQANRDAIREAVRNLKTPDVWPNLYGDGKTAERILSVMLG